MFKRTYEEDRRCVGLRCYKGVAKFWDPMYNSIMRGRSRKTKRYIHGKLMDAKLDPGGVTNEHFDIIAKNLGLKYY